MIESKLLPRGIVALLVVLVGLVAGSGGADAKSQHFDVQARAKPCGTGCKIKVTLRNGGDATATVSIIPQARRSSVQDRQAAVRGTLTGGVRLGQVTIGGTETHEFDLTYGGELQRGTPFAIVTGWGSSHVWGGVLGAHSPADGNLP